MLMDECQHYVKEICAHIPVRYSPGAASCRRESGPGSAHCGTKFSRKRAQPEASDLCGSVYPRLAGGSFANRMRHHAAVNWVQAQPGASCRRELDAGSACQATCARTLRRAKQESTTRLRLGTAWCREVETKAPTKPIRELDAGSARSMENS